MEDIPLIGMTLTPGGDSQGPTRPSASTPAGRSNLPHQIGTVVGKGLGLISSHGVFFSCTVASWPNFCKAVSGCGGVEWSFFCLPHQ